MVQRFYAHLNVLRIQPRNKISSLFILQDLKQNLNGLVFVRLVGLGDFCPIVFEHSVSEGLVRQWVEKQGEGAAVHALVSPFKYQKLDLEPMVTLPYCTYGYATHSPLPDPTERKQIRTLLAVVFQDSR